MKMKNTLLLLALFATSASSVLAQSASGTILGSVKDPSGAGVANATVTIVNQSTGLRGEIPTESGGDFAAPYVPLGSYKVTAKAPGFKTPERGPITLEVDQKARLDFMLTLGEVSETVSVISEAPLIKSDSSEVGEVVGQKTVQDLPLNGRNHVQLLHLTAGVTTGQQGGNIAGTGAFVHCGAGSFNANGQRGQNNNFMVDFAVRWR